MRLIVCLVSIFILAGCQTKAIPINTMGTITPTLAGASGVDVYAGKRASGETVPNFRGDQLLEIRSNEKVIDPKTKRSKYVEFAGANCSLSGTGFEASFVTPIKIRVPIYGYESSELALRCTAKDYAPVLVTRRAYNKTKSDRMASAGSGGLVGVLAIAAVNAMSDEKKHQFLYAPLNVSFSK